MNPSHPMVAPKAMFRVGYNMSEEKWGFPDMGFVLDQNNAPERRLIADHNRCAWQDEADNEDNTFGDRDRAKIKACEWKKWGERKP